MVQVELHLPILSNKVTILPLHKVTVYKIKKVNKLEINLEYLKSKILALVSLENNKKKLLLKEVILLKSKNKNSKINKDISSPKMLKLAKLLFNMIKDITKFKILLKLKLNSPKMHKVIHTINKHKSPGNHKEKQQ
jgi:hypothetical protein